LEAVFRGDGDRKTCGCRWLNGVHTPCQHWVSQGMGTYFSTCLPLHLFPCIPLIYIHSYPVLSSKARTSLAGSSIFWFACPFYAQAYRQNTCAIQQAPTGCRER
jgi:hypothetical protein